MEAHNKAVLVAVWLDPAVAERVDFSAKANPFSDVTLSEWIRMAITEKLERCEHWFEPVGNEYHCKRCGVVFTIREYNEWEADQEFEQGRELSINDRVNCL